MDTGPCSEAIASGTKIWCFLFAHDHEEAIYRYGPALFTIFFNNATHGRTMHGHSPRL